MKIAVFTDSYLPQINGVVTQIENICEGMKKSNFLIIAPSPTKEFFRYSRDNKEVLLLPSFSLPTYKEYRVFFGFSKEVEEALLNFNPDIIHIHTPFGVGWLGLSLAKKHKIPFLATYHTHIPDFLVYLPIPIFKRSKLAKILSWHYLRSFYNNCQFVTTPTVAMKKLLSENGVNSEILPNAINFKLFSKYKKRKFSGNKLKLIYFGRVGFEKNIDVLIKAAELLAKKNKNFSLSIVGSGPALDSLVSLVKSANLEKYIKFYKPMKGKNLARFVAKHDVFVTASTIETQGLTIIESMAAGLCCVGANYLAIPDSIKDNYNGYLFEPFNYVQLAEKLELCFDRNNLKRLSKGSYAFAKAFSIENVAKITKSFYEMIIEKNSCASGTAKK